MKISKVMFSCVYKCHLGNQVQESKTDNKLYFKKLLRCLHVGHLSFSHEGLHCPRVKLSSI